uniref:Uncharacterized protein n=1 Tax=Marseillevirus LCMAC103 TaxID=2506604 RepID=A0A481YVN8_9VIRU|nr:MAG: hypothetical protein LCMAC103_03090 [Marseillevirus LCMAC103]
MPDRILPIAAGLLIAFLVSVAGQQCAKIPAPSTLALIVLVVYPLLLARRAADKKDRMILMGAFSFGVFVFALAYVFSIVEAHKRPSHVYLAAAFAVLLAGFLVAGHLSNPGLTSEVDLRDFVKSRIHG